MSALILDAGALVAADRDDRAMMARLRASQRHGLELRTNAMVVAQVGLGILILSNRRALIVSRYGLVNRVKIKA